MPINKVLIRAVSGEFTCCLTGGPGPLEIITAQPAGHVNTFADEIEARHGFRCHAAGIEAGRIHAAKCDFRRAIPSEPAGLICQSCTSFARVARALSDISARLPVSPDFSTTCCASRFGRISARAVWADWRPFFCFASFSKATISRAGSSFRRIVSPSRQ